MTVTAPDDEAASAGRRPLLPGLDPTSPSQIADPYPMLAEARATTPVVYLPDLDMWCVTRHSDAVAVFLDAATFSNGAAHSFRIPKPPALVAEIGEFDFPNASIINRLDPPDHTRIRRLMSRTFTPRRIAVYEDGLREFTHGLIDGFLDEGSADVVNQYAWPITHRQITRLIGAREGVAPTVHGWINSFFALTGTREMSEAAAVENWRNLAAFQAWTHDLLQEKRAHPADDLLSDMIQIADEGDEGAFSHDELFANAVGLLIAGTSAPAVLISQCILRLLSHPAAWEEARADRTLLANTVEETLRFSGPVRGMVRTATTDVVIGGVPIPAGSRIYLSLASAGRDEQVFDDAAIYDIRRHNAGEHLGLGKGAHFCLGAPFARLQARVAIDSLMDRLPGPALAEPGSEPAYSPSMIAPSPLALRVHWSTAEEKPS